MKQSKWLQKKIAERDLRASAGEGKRQRAAGRHDRMKEITNLPVEEDNELLNRLLDQWEIKEYGKVQTR